LNRSGRTQDIIIEDPYKPRVGNQCFSFVYWKNRRILRSNLPCYNAIIALQRGSLLSHFFCTDVWKLWMKLTKWLDCSCSMPQTIDLLLESWNALVTGKFQRKTIILLSHNILWVIMILTLGNKLIFENKNPDWSTMFFFLWSFTTDEQ
jgi:hypothetical protein